MNPYMYQQPMGFPQQPMGFPQQSMGFPKPPTSSGNILSGIIILAIICVIIWATVFRKDGKLLDWGNWSSCNKPCGGGEQIRERKYIPPEFGGKDDPDKAKIKETQPCNVDPCKIDGYMSEWINDGSCVKSQSDLTLVTCGPGKIKQIRKYIPPQNGGIDVSESEKNKLSQWIICNKEECKNQDGYFTDWVEELNKCYNSSQNSQEINCGTGVIKETREYIQPKGTGRHDPNKNKLTQFIKQCHLSICPEKKNGYCTEWKIPKCECINNVYIKNKTREYIPPIGGGQDNNCKDSLILAEKCDSGLCPQDGKFENFPTPDKNNCTPPKGKNRSVEIKAKYIQPIGTGKYPEYIEDNFKTYFNTIHNLKVNTSDQFKEVIGGKMIQFTRRLNENNTLVPALFELTKREQCDDIDNFSPETIQKLWKEETKCTNNYKDFIIPNITIDKLRYEPDPVIIRNTFKNSKYNINNLKNTDTQADIQNCYGGDFMVIDTDRHKSKLYSGTLITNQINNRRIDIQVLSNNGWRLMFGADGNLVLFNPSGVLRWRTKTININAIHVRMQHDGNLVIYNSDNVGVWYSDTYNNNGAYLELFGDGQLVIRNRDNLIIKQIYADLGGAEYIILDNAINGPHLWVWETGHVNYWIAKHPPSQQWNTIDGDCKFQMFVNKDGSNNKKNKLYWWNNVRGFYEEEREDRRTGFLLCQGSEFGGRDGFNLNFLPSGELWEGAFYVKVNARPEGKKFGQVYRRRPI